MSIGIMDNSPPYLRFEQRAVEDRDASIKANKYVAKDVDFVIVQQIGSRNTHEKPAEEWLVDQDRLASHDRIPRDWPAKFRQLYAQYKAGLEPTREGTSVRNWPMISRAQAENLVRANVLTVEDLAEASEQALASIGMEARQLKYKAVAWLEAADKNKSAAQLDALRAEIGNKDARIASLEERLLAMESRLPALPAPEGGESETGEDGDKPRGKKKAA